VEREGRRRRAAETAALWREDGIDEEVPPRRRFDLCRRFGEAERRRGRQRALSVASVGGLAGSRRGAPEAPALPLPPRGRGRCRVRRQRRPCAHSRTVLPRPTRTVAPDDCLDRAQLAPPRWDLAAAHCNANKEDEQSAQKPDSGPTQLTQGRPPPHEVRTSAREQIWISLTHSMPAHDRHPAPPRCSGLGCAKGQHADGGRRGRWPRSRGRRRGSGAGAVCRRAEPTAGGGGRGRGGAGKHARAQPRLPSRACRAPGQPCRACSRRERGCCERGGEVEREGEVGARLT